MEKTWTLVLLGFVAAVSCQYPVYTPPLTTIIQPDQQYYRIVPNAPHVSYVTVPSTAAAAKCVLQPASTSTVSGELELYQSAASSPVQVWGTIYGLSPGHHGFHLHQDGNTGNDCKAAGPHFNPHKQTHGGPHDVVRHAGDFGNILAFANGTANVQFEDKHISLTPDQINYAVGRAIVVHAGEDDLGKGGNEESLKTGNAGGRLACCVVEAISYK